MFAQQLFTGWAMPLVSKGDSLSFLKKWELCTWTIYLHCFHPLLLPQTPPWVPTTSFTLQLFPFTLITHGLFIIIVLHTPTHAYTRTHECVHTHFYNQPSLFSNAHMCLCPELPTWNWTSYARTNCWKNLILPLSGAIDPWSSLSRMGPCEMTTFHIGMVTGVAIMLVLFKQLISLRFHGYIFPVIPRRYYLVASILGLWLLQPLCPLFPDLASKTNVVGYHSIGSLPEHAGKTLPSSSYC